MSMPSYYKLKKFSSPVTYAVKHKDYDTRMASRSGGIFTALSDQVLKNQGVVYGCILDENFMSVHIRADNVNDRNRMRGSKYIQSEMRDVFHAVKSDLLDGRTVLFSGTSCQVAGLLGFLEKDYHNLLCVDIVCHGVPSPMIWKDYLEWQEKKNGSKIVKVDFRNKKDFGWKAHVESLIFQNGKLINSRIFTTLFYGHSVLRPCCYKCPYKDVIHPGNITIADYWGIDVAAPGFNDNKGVSLVLINDEKGKEAFENCADRLEIRLTKIEDSMQPPLKDPFDEPIKRTEFWRDYSHTSFETVARKYGGNGLIYKTKKKIKRLINRLRFK